MRTIIRGYRDSYGVPMEEDYIQEIVIESDWNGIPMWSDEDREYYKFGDDYIIKDDDELKHYIKHNMDLVVDILKEYFEENAEVTNTYEIMDEKGF